MSRHVVVIGAGVMGAVSAVEALADGHRVTLVDPSEAGSQDAASYGNAGWLSSHSVIPPAEPGIWKKVPRYLLDPLGPLAIRWSHLARVTPWLLRYLASGWTHERIRTTALALRTLLVDAPQLHQSLAQRVDVAHLIEQRGVLHVYLSRADFEAEAAAWRIRREVGIEWTELAEEELRLREPNLAPRYRFAVCVEEAGSCRDPGAYVAALVAHVRSQGALWISGRATGLNIRDGRLQGVLLQDKREIPCDAAVIAAGVRSGALAAKAGDRLPLEAERGYHVMLDLPDSGPRTSLSVADCKVVVNRMEKGLRVAGQVEIAAVDAAPNWRRAEILRDHLLSIFPDLPRNLPAGAFHYWLGCRPSMPDGLPCIGPASATPDVVYAFGHGHVGLVASARTARLVAQLLSGRSPEISLTPFDPKRFA